MSAVWNDSQPIYLQVKNFLVAKVIEGVIREGEAVPSVRQWAVEMEINPLTVARAYRELSDEGVLEKRRGVGMFVCPGASKRLLEQERSRFLTNEWPLLKERLDRLGLMVNHLP